jgi:hypothetical protein
MVHNATLAIQIVAIINIAIGVTIVTTSLIIAILLELARRRSLWVLNAIYNGVNAVLKIGVVGTGFMTIMAFALRFVPVPHPQ